MNKINLSKQEIKEIRKGSTRAKFIIFAGRNIIGALFKKICNLNNEKVYIDEEPFILMANHGDNLDAAIEITGIRRYMRFVMSDHLLRKPIMRTLLNIVASPIVYHREKGSDSLYNEVVRNLNAGVNVAIYIEGGKTNNGETGYISKRNATMVKEGNCALVTYRNKGGYLKVPRWADNKRKGPSYGELVNIYSKDDIRKMTEDELYEHILEDLYFNDYEEQRKSPQKYIAENPAQSAEIVLYCCPGCKAMGTLTSKGDKIFCSCGFEAKIDDYGFWHSPDMDFDDIVRWDKFQKGVLKELTEAKRGTYSLLFEDTNQIVYSLDENGNRVLKTSDACISLFGDCLKISGADFNDILPFENIKKIKTASKMTLLIVTDKAYYEIHSKKPRSATKYQVAVRFLQGKENY